MLTQGVNMIRRNFQLNNFYVVVISNFPDYRLHTAPVWLSEDFVTILWNPDEVIHQSIDVMAVSL